MTRKQCLSSAKSLKNIKLLTEMDEEDVVGDEENDGETCVMNFRWVISGLPEQ